MAILIPALPRFLRVHPVTADTALTRRADALARAVATHADRPGFLYAAEVVQGVSPDAVYGEAARRVTFLVPEIICAGRGTAV